MIIQNLPCEVSDNGSDPSLDKSILRCLSKPDPEMDTTQCSLHKYRERDIDSYRLLSCAVSARGEGSEASDRAERKKGTGEGAHPNRFGWFLYLPNSLFREARSLASLRFPLPLGLLRKLVIDIDTDFMLPGVCSVIDYR